MIWRDSMVFRFIASNVEMEGHTLRPAFSLKVYLRGRREAANKVRLGSKDTFKGRGSEV